MSMPLHEMSTRKEPDFLLYYWHDDWAFFFVAATPDFFNPLFGMPGRRRCVFHFAIVHSYLPPCPKRHFWYNVLSLSILVVFGVRSIGTD